MAKITASVYTSHIPAVGVAWDLKKTGEDYWKPVFAGYEYSKEWQKENNPDVIILVYNDHTNNFGFDLIPTFALGMNEEFQPSDEGWGRRPVPNVPGDQNFASHLAHSVIEQGFDLTLCYEIQREIVREARRFDAKEFRILAAPNVIDLFLDEESQSLAMLIDFIGKPISLAVETAYTQEQYDIVLI